MRNGGRWIIFSAPSPVVHVWSCTSNSCSPKKKNTKFYHLFCSLLEPTPRTQCTMIVQCDLDVMFTLIFLCCDHCLDQLISAMFLHGTYWIKLPAPQDKKLGKIKCRSLIEQEVINSKGAFKDLFINFYF